MEYRYTKPLSVLLTLVVLAGPWQSTIADGNSSRDFNVLPCSLHHELVDADGLAQGEEKVSNTDNSAICQAGHHALCTTVSCTSQLFTIAAFVPLFVPGISSARVVYVSSLTADAFDIPPYKPPRV